MIFSCISRAFRTAPLSASWRVLARLLAILISLSAGPIEAWAGPLDLEPEGVRPGIVASYRSLVDQDAKLQLIEPKPAFYLGRSSPHPRIPAGPFEVEWSGIIHLQEQSPLSFHAFVGGELTMDVDGVKVLQGRGLSDNAALSPKEILRREPGQYRFTIKYRSLEDVPARVQLFWESATFAREPLPAWRLSHITAELPPAFSQDELARQGRAAADRLGCVRCHQSAFPGLSTPPPGPSLADAGERLSRDWLLAWLDDPAKLRPGARMPALFPATRTGFVERWLIADAIARPASAKPEPTPAPGDHRAGRLAFLMIGCAACHFVPELKRADQVDLDRVSFHGLGDRLRPGDLATFLGNPRARYPDGRMPRLPLSPETARDIAAYLLLWSKPTTSPIVAEPSAAEIQVVTKRLGVYGKAATATALLAEKGCSSCHTGLGPSLPIDVPIAANPARGCLADAGMPRHQIDPQARKTLTAYLAVAAREKHPSPFASRRESLARAGCVRCHSRDGDRPPPIEEVGTTIAGAYLQTVPFQHTPRLNNPHQKFMRDHLITTVREGIAGLRAEGYTYRMPAFGTDAELLVQALAEQDGQLPDAADPAPQPVKDPTVGTLAGPELVGFQGYGCISCHVWNGKQLSQPDPGAVGPDLTRVAGRIRRDWFDRFLDAPLRSVPGTPMPAIFEHGQPARLTSVLDGDSQKQKDALWSYFAQGKHAPVPKPPPALPITASAADAPLVAQIPIRMPDSSVVESLAFLNASNDLLIYDVGSCDLRSIYNGGRILRSVQGRLRQFFATGTLVADGLVAKPALQLVVRGKAQEPKATEFLGYEPLPDGIRVRWRARFASEIVDVDEIIQLKQMGSVRELSRELKLSGAAPSSAIVLRVRQPKGLKVHVSASAGMAQVEQAVEVVTARLTPRQEKPIVARVSFEIPPARSAPAWEGAKIVDTSPAEGSLDRPGYHAIAYPRPKTISGEDRVMPVALAVHPKDGRVFVASIKTGEVFLLRDPTGDGKQATFETFGRGLFQDAYSMLAEEQGLFVLHRRNLTRIDYGDHGKPLRVDRVARLPHDVADSYDYPYGLVRDKRGGFIVAYAPYANTTMPGSGGAVSLVPGEAPREVAYGMRNPLGWSVGPDREVFYTDNQGEWVAANKLCHLAEGSYNGFPNRAQMQHVTKSPAPPAVWIPYGWGRSVNGVTFDNTGGKFGPFAGQFFLAEVMFGGAIVRADVEKVNGQYQGACFPFWGKGLLGPVSLAFDPRGRLFVGGITEPGWMAQPDRGALFRIDFNGQVPFELRTIRARPHGFRVEFTAPVDRKSALDPASYHVEHYRYEYTGAYGSPELDRASAAVEAVKLSDDGQSVELTLPPLVKDRVYMISAPSVHSTRGDTLVHTTGAYTLNSIPMGN